MKKEDPPARWRARAPRPQALRRGRLAALCEAGDGHRLTLVVAPAGAGKTTLLAQLAADARCASAWYAAEPSDATPARFLAGLRAACELALGRLPTGEWRSTDDACIALDELAEPLVLCIDDLHALLGTAAENELERLVEHLPAGVRILAATRRRPDINLSRLLVAGSLLELDSDDLRFRSWEVEELFRDVYGEPLPPGDLAVLARRTEGWAAGLQLFHLACRGRSPAERRRLLASLGTHFALASEYLARNVLADLEPELSDFLLETCVLGELTGPLCDELLGTTGSQARLAALAERQVFTRAVDERGATYRYHEVLRRHLELELVERIGEVAARERFRRAGALLESRGALADAIRAQCRAEDWESVARLRGPRGRAPADDRRWLARPAAGVASPGRPVAAARRRAPRALGRPARRSGQRLQRGGGRVRHPVGRRPRAPRAAGARAVPRSAGARRAATSRASCGRRRCGIPPTRRGRSCSTAPSASAPPAWACCWPAGCGRPPRGSRTRAARRTRRRCSRPSPRRDSRRPCCSPAEPKRDSRRRATPPSSRIASARRGWPGSHAPSGRSATPGCGARPRPRLQPPGERAIAGAARSPGSPSATRSPTAPTTRPSRCSRSRSPRFTDWVRTCSRRGRAASLALALSRTSDPDARGAAHVAERTARAAGTRAPLAYTYLALAALEPPRRAEYLALASDTADECGLALPGAQTQSAGPRVALRCLGAFVLTVERTPVDLVGRPSACAPAAARARAARRASRAPRGPAGAALARRERRQRTPHAAGRDLGAARCPARAARRRARGRGISPRLAARCRARPRRARRRARRRSPLPRGGRPRRRRGGVATRPRCRRRRRPAARGRAGRLGGRRARAQAHAGELGRRVARALAARTRRGGSGRRGLRARARSRPPPRRAVAPARVGARGGGRPRRGGAGAARVRAAARHAGAGRTTARVSPS